MTVKKKQPHVFVEQQGLLPPQAIDVEKAIIGTLLLYDNIDVVSMVNFLKPEDFLNEANKIVFEAITRILRRSDPVDVLTVKHELERMGKLEDIGGVLQLAEYGNTSIKGSIMYHARIVKQKALQRQLISLCHDYKLSAYDETKDIFESIETLSAEINEIIGHIDTDDKKMTAKEISNLFLTTGDESKNMYAVRKIGWPKFDKIVGISLNKILLISGKSKDGKTKFVSSIMFKLLENYDDISIFWVTLEDPGADILASYLSTKVRIQSKKIKQRNFSEDDMKAIEEHVNRFNSFDIVFQEQGARTAKIGIDFKNFCQLRPNRFNILIIDNILSLSDRDDFKQDLNSMYDYIMSQILRTKQQTKALIIPIHHFKDMPKSEERLAKAYRPVLSDMKGTEAFHRTPNQVLLLNNPAKHKDLVDEYRDYKDVLEKVFICDTGANRDDKNNDQEALIRFAHDLNYNLFIEI